MRLDLLGDERLLIDGPVQPARRRGVLLFPQSYAVGMASLALHTLYAALNRTPGMSWERAFVDPARDSTRASAVCSVETGTPLRDFDVVAITSSYELDWPAIPAALEDGGVPPLRQTRREVHSTQAVLIGGPAVSAAPLPLSAIYDAACIGEIEPVAEILQKALLLDRDSMLDRLAAVRGFFVPEVHAPLEPGMLARRCARNLDEFDTTSVILTPNSEFPDRFLVEIGRGCGRSCSFCLARQIYRPVRWRSVARIMQAVRHGLQYTGQLGLIAAAVSDHPHLPELCAELGALPSPVGVSTSSLRLETATPELLGVLARGGQKTVTYAPEAATERLRQAIGKALSDDELFAAVDRAAAAGLSRVRLYLMVGLPGETPEDREAIPALARRLTEVFPQLSFRVSVSAFSPRPHTGFEMAALPPLRDLRSWLAAAQRSLKALRRVEVATDSARWAVMQAAMSRADDRLGIALARRQALGFGGLVNSLAAEGLVVEELIGRPDEAGFLPWKIVDPTCAD